MFEAVFRSSPSQHHRQEPSVPPGEYPAVVSMLQDKLSTINESLAILFATLQSLTAVVPPGAARAAVQTLADMGSPLLAVSGNLQGLRYG